jgi:hypothetical protein
VGNLESKPESYKADAWVILDGQQRYRRAAFSREDGPEEIDVSLTDHDRFLVLAVTDSGANAAYDWVAFGDAVIEMRDRREGSDAVARNCPSHAVDSENRDVWPHASGEAGFNPAPTVASDADQQKRSYLAANQEFVDSDARVQDSPWREMDVASLGGG